MIGRLWIAAIHFLGAGQPVSQPELVSPSLFLDAFRCAAGVLTPVHSLPQVNSAVVCEQLKGCGIEVIGRMWIVFVPA